MARNRTLDQVVQATLAEAGLPARDTPGRNMDDQVVQTVRRVYERLHGDHTWRHLILQRDIQLAAGQRYYSWPFDLDPDRTGRVWTLEDSQDHWREVCYGIGPEEWNHYNPERDERADPVRAWQRWTLQREDGDMVEVWPLPASNSGLLRLEGMPYPKRLVRGNDTVDLDDQMIALFAAGELLTRHNSADAEIKLQHALARQNSLQSQQNASDPVFSMNRSRNAGSWQGVRVRAPRT